LGVSQERASAIQAGASPVSNWRPGMPIDYDQQDWNLHFKSQIEARNPGFTVDEKGNIIATA